MTVNHRTAIVSAANWASGNRRSIGYSENLTIRADFLHFPHFHLPFSTDCSGFCSWCYWTVGAPDPNGHAYHYIGDTESIAAWGHQITLAQTEPGDFCILGLELPLDDQHMVILVNKSNPANPTVVSLGDSQGPITIPLNDDVRSKRFFRVNTETPDPIDQ